MKVQDLTAEELQSLRELLKGGLAAIIPYAHEKRLVGLGLASSSLSGLRLTPAGEFRIAEESARDGDPAKGSKT